MKQTNNLSSLFSILFSLTLSGLLFLSCNKDNTLDGINSPVSSKSLVRDQNGNGSTSVIYPEDINVANILPEALEYYQNIANVAKWYYLHPDIRDAASISYTDTSSFNPLVAKLKSLTVLDSLDNEQSIFELSLPELDSFLNAFVTIEASQLSEKLTLLNSNEDTSIIRLRNIAFDNVFPTAQSLFQSNEDPYWSVQSVLGTFMKRQIKYTNSGISCRGTPFWLQVILNFHLRHKFVHWAPNSLDAQTFVDNIRASVRKGRFLIALPGGFSTEFLIIIYVGALETEDWYDVGHVAVFDKNNNELPAKVRKPTHYEMTIGTNSDEGMTLEENLKRHWCDKHGAAFVGQVFSVRWKRSGLRFRKVKTNVNNNNIAAEAVKTLGAPYCHVWQIPYAKWAAPGRFICSSAAWWDAKKGTNVNISDFWSTTVWPRDVFLSDRVDIIDNTLH